MDCLLNLFLMADDLPLLANVDDILVSHYSFIFDCNFKNKCFNCEAILFLKPVITCNDFHCSCLSTCVPNDMSLKHSTSKQCTFSSEECSTSNEIGFMLVLDCHKIKINNVSAINISNEENEQLTFSMCESSLISGSNTLSFVTSDWSLKIWTTKKCCKYCFPKAIKISYETLPSGPSLLWVTDQDGKPAVFTYGSSVNNRSLFPCQEPPIAMATWEAMVTVHNSAIVLMSGDEEPVISHGEKFTKFYYCTKKVLPLSTLCLAIGFWEKHDISQRYESCPKCRIFAPPSLIDLSIQELFEFVPYCLKISEDMLGPYPFSRIDFLIVPPTFGSLGMASPNVIFLSQSLLVKDGSMCSRISHEIAHGWFGLLIGALDWTEEWLSEGFATFVEDHLHTWTINMDAAGAKDYRELRAIIRKKTLLDEVKNTENELQIMRSSKGIEDKSTIDGVDATVLKNGQNPIKGFIQVHYIKGYFLLKYLSDAVGIDNFIKFLRDYVKRYAGHLVTSKEFLTMYLNYFPATNETITIDGLCENWLHNPGIPDVILKTTITSENKFFKEVEEETEKWSKIHNALSKKQLKRRKPILDNFLSLTPEQTILLLENVLDFETLRTQTLKYMNDIYNFKDSNPEIQHRWFELVVMYKFKSEYSALRKFLMDHLAMGVYLYGEMIFSTSPSLKTIAKECYETLNAEMEPNFRTTILQMLQDSNT